MIQITSDYKDKVKRLIHYKKVVVYQYRLQANHMAKLKKEQFKNNEDQHIVDKSDTASTTKTFSKKNSVKGIILYR